MKNFVMDGDVITVAAPYDVANGDGVMVGSVFGVATKAAKLGDSLDLSTEGVFDLAADSTQSYLGGTELYWDTVNKRCTSVTGVGSCVAVCVAPKAAGDATVRGKLQRVFKGLVTDPSAQAAVAGAAGITVVPTGADDTSNINAAVQAVNLVSTGGHVRGVPGKTYRISGPIVMRSNVKLDMTGCYVMLLAGNQTNMVTTLPVVSPDLTANDAGTTAGSGTVNTALGASASVGQWACVYGAGAVSSEMIGVISAKTSTSVTLTKLNGDALTAVNTLSSARIVIVTPLTNVSIIGGRWDRGGNGPNGGVAARGSNVNGHSLFLKYIKGLIVDIEGAYSTGGITFVWPTVVQDFWIRVRDASVVRTVCQVVGPAWRGRVDYIAGYCNDDMVNCCGNVYNEQTDTAGDVIDVTVGVLVARGVGGSALKLNACAGYTVSVPRVDALTGTAQQMFFAGEDTGRPETTGGTYSQCTIGNLAGVGGYKQILLLSPSGLDLTATLTTRQVSPVLVQGTDTNAWIARLKLDFDVAGDVRVPVTLAGNAQVRNLNVTVNGAYDNTTGYPAHISSSVSTVKVDRTTVSGVCAFTGTQGLGAYLPAGTFGYVNIAAKLTFPANTGENMGVHVNGATVGYLDLNGLDITKGSAAARLESGSTVTTLRLGTMRTNTTDRVANVRVPCNVVVDGVVETTSNLNPPIITVGASIAVTGGGTITGYAGVHVTRSASELITLQAPNVSADMTTVSRTYSPVVGASKALAQIQQSRAGQKPFLVALVGDSNTAGAGSGDNSAGGTTGMTNGQKFSVGAQLAKIIDREFMYCTNDAFFGDQACVDAGVTLQQFDPRFGAFGAGWTLNGSASTFGGRMFVGASGGAGALLFTPKFPWNRVRLIFASNSVSATSITAKAGGTSIGIVNAYSATNALLDTTLSASGSAAMQTFSLDTVTGGTCYLCGAIFWDADNPGAVVVSGGWWGATLASLNKAATPWEYRNVAASLGAGLYITNATINDAGANLDAASFGSSSLALHQALAAVGDVIVTGLTPTNGQTNNGNGDSYKTQLLSVVSSIGTNFGLIDWRDQYGATYAASNAAGWAYDASHLKGIGYARQAAIYANRIKSIASAS